MQELIKVYAQTPEKSARFRGKYLQKAEQYFPRLDQWCPPIYIGVTPPGGLPVTYHHIPSDASYIYLGEAEIIPGWNDFDAQTEFVFHELAHVVEHKIGKPYDERFAQAIHAAVAAGDMLVYALLSHIMGV
jgi:hypothetical protein